MGLTAKGAEQDRRELSRFLVAAIHGGPAFAVPALQALDDLAGRDALAVLAAASTPTAGPALSIEAGTGRDPRRMQHRNRHPGPRVRRPLGLTQD